MTISEACMNGLEITMPDGTLHQVDFVVVEDARVIAYLLYWWEVDWASGGQQADGVLVFDYPLKQVGKVWHIDSPHGVAVLSPYPADGDSEKAFGLSRRWTDTNRGEYLLALAGLRQAYQAVDFSEWMALVLERPEIDVVDEFKKSNLGMRKIGSICLLDSNNKIVDGMVVDENGNAAVSASNVWLASLAEAWQTREERPDVEDYLNWVKSQRPYGPYSLSDPTVSLKEGHIEKLAISLIG